MSTPYPPSDVRHEPAFEVRQKLTLTVHQFELHAIAPDGTPGRPLAFAQQKRMAFKELVTFYGDAAKTRPLFSFKARTVMDLGGVYDVLDEYGRPLATFQRNFAQSLLRTTYHVQGPGYEGTGQERNPVVALLRRFTELDFLPVHFDYASSTGEPLLAIERQWALRDKYTVTVPDPRVDFRVAASLAVGMDVLLQR